MPHEGNSFLLQKGGPVSGDECEVLRMWGQALLQGLGDAGSGQRGS